jgi:hypothetical protein
MTSQEYIGKKPNMVLYEIYRKNQCIDPYMNNYITHFVISYDIILIDFIIT